MDNNAFTATWNMIYRHSFIGVKEGYSMHVEISTIPPYWVIVKDGIVVDECYNHPITKCELSARVQAERCLNEILKQNK
jgi:hypothetical protein